jgi:hypothetical protein
MPSFVGGSSTPGGWDAQGAAARGEDVRAGEFGSRLAHAFTRGYYCDSEQELQRVCGVRLSR